ncbi:MAG TPA: 2-oxoacid:acceptor oxidoreductase subunit alpha [Syntrophales bacterium]|nr:2-oxoacid:acceptor oxidoreductase subunit alpha [Syntrophales bacterium]
MEFNLIIAGEAGHGLLSIELGLTEILARTGYHFFATKNYMSRIRGGHNFHMIRIADRPVHALSGNVWEMVLAFDEEADRRHRPTLAEGGILIDQEEIRQISQIIRPQFAEPMAVNTVLMGIVLSAIGFDPARLTDIGLPEDRRAMLGEGFRYAGGKKLTGKHFIKSSSAALLRFDGNQALALGAILGGCQFMAAYPMTPATSIMNYFANAAKDLPIHFEQAEDEIAAVNMALGASYAGLRAMTASSGGGFDLMTEGLSLAGMTETPIVIMVSQRPGPSTGLPTRTEQGELNLLVHAGHGEFPRMIFAPGAIVEAIEIARDAFDLADSLQCPILILTDQYFADSIQTVEEEIPQSVSQRTCRPYDETYRRYALNKGGLSPLTYPGIGKALVRLDSDEHGEDGRITEDLDLRARMVDKRMQKVKYMTSLSRKPTFCGNPEAEWMLLSWGSNRQIVEEAIRHLNEAGIAVAALHFSQVYPLSPEMVAPWMLDRRKLVCLENNAGGQFAGLLKRELGLDIRYPLLKYNGECFTVEEIHERMLAIMEVKP